MKMIVPAAVAVVLALGACSQADGDAAAKDGAAAAPAAAPVGVASAAFAGLPESCVVWAEKLDRARQCAKKMVEGQVTPEDAAAEDVSAKAKVDSLATDLRKLPAAEAAEACTASHELTDQMTAAMGC